MKLLQSAEAGTRPVGLRATSAPGESAPGEEHRSPGTARGQRGGREAVRLPGFPHEATGKHVR